jgi:hypothetical protein
MTPAAMHWSGWRTPGQTLSMDLTAAFLRKPFGRRQLLEAIERGLGER